MSINLLPPQLKAEGESFPWIASLTFFGIVWLCTFLLVLGWGQVRVTRRTLEETQEAKVEAEKIIAQRNQAQKKLEGLELDLDSWQIEQRRAGVFTEFLAQLRWHVPTRLWFTRLAIGKEGELELAGGTLNLASLSCFLEELEAWPNLGEVTLVSTKQQPQGYYTFQLKAPLNNLPVKGGGEYGQE